MVSERLAIVAVLLAAVSGAPGWLPRKVARARERLSVALMVAAGVCGLLAGCLSFLPDASAAGLELPSSLPGGRLLIGMDALSGVFVVQISLIAALGAVFGLEYWSERAHPTNARRLQAAYGAATAGMLLLVVARNAVLFLIGWEVMALAAFLAVTTEDDKPEVRERRLPLSAGDAARHACLFAMFAVLFAASGSLDFAGWSLAMQTPVADAVFVLALARLRPQGGHHAAARLAAERPRQRAQPRVGADVGRAHQDGHLRARRGSASLCAAPPLWWGEALLALGVLSSVLGVGCAPSASTT